MGKQLLPIVLPHPFRHVASRWRTTCVVQSVCSMWAGRTGDLATRCYCCRCAFHRPSTFFGQSKLTHTHTYPHMYIHSLPHTCHLESVCCGLFKLTLRIRPVGAAAWLLRWRQPFAYFFHNSRIPELLRVWHVVQINQKVPPTASHCGTSELLMRCLDLLPLARFPLSSDRPLPPPARPLPYLPGVCHQFARLEIEKARNLWGNKVRATPTTSTHPPTHRRTKCCTWLILSPRCGCWKRSCSNVTAHQKAQIQLAGVIESKNHKSHRKRLDWRDSWQANTL